MGDASINTTPRLVVSNYGTRIAVADSHIGGKTTALDITIGSTGGVIAHVTEDEALRLAAALLSSIARNRRQARRAAS